MLALRVKIQAKPECTPIENVEEQRYSNDLAIPTLESIITQIQTEIPKLTKEDAEDMAGEIYAEFKFIENDEVARFLGPTNPRLQICKWSNQWIMLDRLRYPSDYSPLTIYHGIQFGSIRFYIVVIHAIKCITVHYVEM